MYDQLHEGIAHFWFVKTDGTLRSAYGILVMEIVKRHGGISDDESKESSKEDD